VPVPVPVPTSEPIPTPESPPEPSPAGAPSPEEPSLWQKIKDTLGIGKGYPPGYFGDDDWGGNGMFRNGAPLSSPGMTPLLSPGLSPPGLRAPAPRMTPLPGLRFGF
jgi:hypothetical protein